MMDRDTSPADRYRYEDDSSSARDRFYDIEVCEGDRYRSVRPRATETEPQDGQGRDSDAAIPFARGRATLYERDHGHRLTLSQIHALRDLAKFRVIAVLDLAQFVYRDRDERAAPEVRDLVRQGLVRTGVFEGPEGIPRELATLTPRGHRLIRANKLVGDEQSTYSGFVKPKEANHDADLYRMYQEEVARITSEGGQPIRVVLDYELKKKVNRDIVRYGGSARPEIAARHGLIYVRGKIPIPDLQIEYATRDGDIARISLELVTEHYRGGSVGEKVRAGFKLYTPHGETDRLRRVLDQQELTAEILSL